MTKERLEEVLENLLYWGIGHNREFMECMIHAMDLTDEEIRELRLEKYGLVKGQAELLSIIKAFIVTSILFTAFGIVLLLEPTKVMNIISILLCSSDRFYISVVEY
mgnify:CR=1 FL=1